MDVGTTVVALAVVVTGGLTVVPFGVVVTGGLTVVPLSVVGTKGANVVALGIVAGDAEVVSSGAIGRAAAPSECSAPKTQCASAHSSSAAVVMASFMFGARKPTLTAV